MVSIKDVAKRAGVAVSTVSKVINGYPNVSEGTKKKVRQAIDELHYVPNAIAAALSSKSSTRIAMLVNSSQHSSSIDEIDMKYLSGALAEAKENGLEIRTFFFSMFEDMKCEDIIRDFESQRIGALIFYGINRNDQVMWDLIRHEQFKSVLVDTPIVEKNISSVWIDQAQAQFDVAEKTYPQVNGKKLLYVAGKKDGYVTGGRIEGITRFAEKYGMELIVRYGDFSEEKARDIVLEDGKDADMIACASDLMAVGAMFAVRRLGKKVPICGFDGIGLLEYAEESINSVRQDFAGISAEAVREAMRLIKGGTGKNIIMDYELVTPEYGVH